MGTVDIAGLHAELEAAGLPVGSVSSDGRVDYSRDLTPTEQTTAQAVIAAHDPDKRTREERDLIDRAKDAAGQLKLYLDRPTPTNAQTAAALKLTIRVLLWLLRDKFTA